MGGSRDGRYSYANKKKKAGGSLLKSVVQTVSLEPCDNILELCSKNQDSPYGELALKPYAKSLYDQALRRRV